MAKRNRKRRVLVTGAAGFIGFHLAHALLAHGWSVAGVDAMTDYYDTRIKRRRLSILKKYPHFRFYKADISSYPVLERVIAKEKPHELVHLAAQAGVRYSLSNPWAYASANYLGTMNVFEAAKRLKLTRVLYASSSSVYGAGAAPKMRETDRTDRPISVYAASKKANEALAHSYTYLYGMETVGLRFFTVYGRWGRPDLSLFKFTKNIVAGKPIDVYNRGKMKRSFTHVSDVVAGIEAILKKKPRGAATIYNLGGDEAVPLLTFIEHIERAVGKKAKKRLLPMQPGDVPETVADCTKARRELGYRARTDIKKGIGDFVSWFMENRAFLVSLSEPKQ